MSKELVIDLKYNQLMKKTISSIGMLIFISLYTIVDSLFVSNFVGTTALAALNIVFPIITVISAFGFMLSSGSVAYVSIKLGQGKIKEAYSSFSLIFVFGIIGVSILSLISFYFIDNFLHFMNINNDLMYFYSKEYLIIILIFSPIYIIQIFVQFFLFVANKGNLSFILTVISGLVNIFFDWLFIVKFKMGIGGAALATSIGYFSSAIYGIVFFFKNKTGLHFVKFKFSYSVLKKVCSNGISEMIGNLSSSITTLIFNYLAMKFAGSNGVAAISIILYCQFLFASVFIGFSMGSSSLIGYAWGAKMDNYLKKLVILCFKIISLFSILMFLFSFFGASFVTSFFCDVSNPVFDIGSNGLRLFSFSFLFCGFSIFTSSLFTSIGDGLRSGISSFLRIFVFTILFLISLPYFIGENGIYLAIPFAEIVMFIINILFIKKLFIKLRK